MGATKEERAVRRTQKWLMRFGPPGGVSDEAFALLSQRLATRTRALVQSTPVFLLDLGALVANFWISTNGDVEKHQQAFAARMLLTYAVIDIGLLVAAVVVQRTERRTALAQPRRVSRPTAVPLRTMLGPTRTAFLITAPLLQFGLAFMLAAVTTGWFRWAYLAGVVVACGLTALGVREASTRATVALDASSLAIDERLRSEDAVSAASPLYLLTLALFPGATSVNGPDWTFFVIAPVGLTIMLFWSWARTAQPWTRKPSLMPGSLAPWVPGTATSENPYAQR